MPSVAIVTGGEGGIGRAIATRLAEAGYRVLSGDLHDSAAAEPQERIFASLDVTSNDDVAVFMERAEQLGDIRALVNCAGVLRDCRADELPDEAVRGMFDVNVLGAARMTAAVTPRMASGSAIVNIGSVSSRLPELDSAVLYGASKLALEAYTRASARALACRGIRVNAVAPGFIDVAMTEAMRKVAYRPGSPLTRVALGRMGRAEEIAECVEFLLSDRASYVVGATLIVDGGLTGP